jgi:uncharacterized protein (TIGR02611 family)
VSEPHIPPIVRRLRERQVHHRRRGRLYRAAWVVAGTLILAAGVAMLALPGPAFVVIPVGLAILSLEFEWAERLLEHALVAGARARERAASSTPAQRLASVTALAAALVAFVVAAVTLDIPVLPV